MSIFRADGPEIFCCRAGGQGAISFSLFGYRKMAGPVKTACGHFADDTFAPVIPVIPLHKDIKMGIMGIIGKGEYYYD